MTEDIKTAVLDFLDQYFCNTEIESDAFRAAVQKMVRELPDYDQRVAFIETVIEAGSLIKTTAETELRRQEAYQLEDK